MFPIYRHPAHHRFVQRRHPIGTGWKRPCRQQPACINDAGIDLKGAPVLGIYMVCFLNDGGAFGGQVHASDIHEFGAATIVVNGHSAADGRHRRQQYRWQISQLKCVDGVMATKSSKRLLALTLSPVPQLSIATWRMMHYGLVFSLPWRHLVQGQALLGRFVHRSATALASGHPIILPICVSSQLKEQTGDK